MDDRRVSENVFKNGNGLFRCTGAVALVKSEDAIEPDRPIVTGGGEGQEVVET